MIKDLSKPSLADNAEQQVKCPVCGFMFAMEMTNAVENTTTCPQCGEEIDLDHTLMVDTSNEDY